MLFSTCCVNEREVRELDISKISFKGKNNKDEIKSPSGNEILGIDEQTSDTEEHKPHVQRSVLSLNPTRRFKNPFQKSKTKKGSLKGVLKFRAFASPKKHQKKIRRKAQSLMEPSPTKKFFTPKENEKYDYKFSPEGKKIEIDSPFDSFYEFSEKSNCDTIREVMEEAEKGKLKLLLKNMDSDLTPISNLSPKKRSVKHKLGFGSYFEEFFDG